MTLNPIQIRKLILPYADLNLEGASQDWLILGQDMGVALTFPVAQSPQGGKLFTARSTGELNVGYSSASSPYTPKPTVSLVPLQTRTTSGASPDFDLTPYNAIGFIYYCTVNSGTAPSLVIQPQAKDTYGNYTNCFNGVNLQDVGGIATAPGPLVYGTPVPATLRFLYTISGTTPSVSFYIDLLSS